MRMTEALERASRDIANEGSNCLLERHHMHLPIADRIKLHTIYYEAILAGIWAFHDVRNAVAIRDECLVSEN